MPKPHDPMQVISIVEKALALRPKPQTS